jgi:hypothetical protein
VSTAGNSSSTLEFIKYLQTQHPEQRIALIWDGASYHKSDEIKVFLASVNDNYEPEQWQIFVFYLHLMHPNKIL